MKNFIFIFLFSISAFSQTIAERQKIISSYDQQKITLLKNEARSYYQSQFLLIEQYKNQFPFLSSETKSLQKIDNGMPIFYSIFNQGSSVTINTNKMYPGGSMGLNVTGLGMLSGVWDGARVRETHQEFAGGRIILGDAATAFSAHATHVTGTIIASGASSTRRGIAYQAQAKTYNWDFDYEEMLSFGNEGFLVSNHSYGYVAAGLPVYRFGAYDVSSIEIDNVSNAFPYYQIVLAAGNDRDDFSLIQVGNKGGYDMLTGTGTSKNAIVVAAVGEVTNYVDNFSVVMSDFSNFGPTDDGRIKPDIAAKGIGVDSCISFLNSNSSYAVYQGTSMAAPAISGMILLLQKHYNNLNPSTYMRASSVRGLICHTAKEAGFNLGPDYEFGWGLANAEAAATIITNRNNSAILEEKTLLNSEIYTQQISIASAQNLSISITWTDPTGNSNIAGDEDNRVPRLKNNLDLKVLKDGSIYYPWKLSVEAPTLAATNNSDNNVDNIEKVDIVNALPGIYTIQVSHKGTLVGGSQVYSLVGNASVGLSLNNDDYLFDNSIFVYPNPANDFLNYNIKNDIEISAININDISGKQVFNDVNVNGTTPINVSNLSAGVYFITFTAENTSVTKKFIKQ